MENNEIKSENTKRKPNIQRILLAGLAIAILIIIIIGIAKIAKWNRGKEYIIDPNVDISTETEDLIFFMDPSLLPDNNYDGNLTILMLGNDTLAYDRGDKNIAEMIADKTDATVYNLAFEGSYMAALESTIDNIENNPVDAFSFFWVSNSIQINDWSMQEDALQYLPDTFDKETYQETIDLAKTIDFNNVDLLLIYYDGHDYLARNPIANPTNMYDVTTMEGSFTGSFERYPINYPNMQCMLIAPTFCYVIDEDGTKEGCDIANLGHGNLPTCLTTLQIQAETYSVSFVDNFYGIKINAETADKFLLGDGITPNEEAREMIAERISRIINVRLIQE